MRKKKETGFTLIELLVVIAIISLMSVIGIASFTDSRNTARILAAQSELTSAIKLAQSYALQGKMQGGITPAYYGVNFSSSGNYYICFGDVSCSGILDGKTYQLNGATLANPTTPLQITFSVPSASVNYPNYPAGLVLNLQFAGKTKIVNINSTGLITQN